MNITTAEFVEKIKQHEDISIIDVREQFEVEQGMIKGAIHIPMNEIQEKMHTLSSHELYYIVCAHGVRSENVTHFLLDNEYKAINVEGGMAEIAPLLSE